MKPDVDAVLRLLAERLMAETLPGLTVPYLQANAQMTSRLLVSAAEQWDAAAAWRAEENAALRRLFLGAAPLVDSPLAARLDVAAQAGDDDLRISTLSAANDRLRALLIELQAAVETRTDDPARRLNDDIWAELARGCERRKLLSSAL